MYVEDGEEDVYEVDSVVASDRLWSQVVEEFVGYNWVHVYTYVLDMDRALLVVIAKLT